MNNKSWISVIGLGKLGAPVAAAIASRGFRVIGVDINPKTITAIKAGQPPVFEPRLANLLKKYRKMIQATDDYQEAVKSSTISFVIVPTPSTKDGSFSNKFVKAAVQGIGLALRKKSSYYLVAIVSTITPGSMDEEILPELEKSSGKKVGDSIGLCYNPSFIALGNVVDDFLNPDFVLIGESDKKAGESLETFYQRLFSRCPLAKQGDPLRIVRMNFINSEITKIALNTFITTKISFANMLASLCQKIPGADADIVTQALGLDSRIGSKYLKGAVAYGGPCFPRDNKALQAFGRKMGLSLSLPRATDEINRKQTKEIAQLIIKRLPKGSTVGILGLSYKQDTDVVEESQGVKLINYLGKREYRLLVYDPVIFTRGPLAVWQGVPLIKAIQQSDALVITTPWPEFKEKLPKLLTQWKQQPIIIIDCWRMLDPKGLPKGVVYIGRGQGI